jgi:hypothetical protein
MKDKKRVAEKEVDEEKRDDGDDSNKDGQLKPVRPKIGEHKDNLQQRSDWFQKRSGKRS